MVSVASAGTADRIAARILFNVLRAGSGTPPRYSSTVFGAPLPFAAELRWPDFRFLMGQCYKSLHFMSMPQTTVQPFDALAPLAAGNLKGSFRAVRAASQR